MRIPTYLTRLASLAASLCALSAAGLIATSWFLNPLCFYLSPVALVAVCFYSLTKRFTDYTHVFLGIALALGRRSTIPLVRIFSIGFKFRTCNHGNTSW